jgi:hypothetical protein
VKSGAVSLIRNDILFSPACFNQDASLPWILTLNAKSIAQGYAACAAKEYRWEGVTENESSIRLGFPLSNRSRDDNNNAE